MGTSQKKLTAFNDLNRAMYLLSIWSISIVIIGCNHKTMPLAKVTNQQTSQEQPKMEKDTLPADYWARSPEGRLSIMVDKIVNKKIVNEIASLTIWMETYSIIPEYQKELFPVLWSYYKIDSYSRAALALMDLSPAQRDSLLAIEHSPKVRARLGDPQAEQSIIDEFEQVCDTSRAYNVYQFEDALKQIVYVNSAKSRATLEAALSSDKVFKRKCSTGIPDNVSLFCNIYLLLVNRLHLANKINDTVRRDGDQRPNELHAWYREIEAQLKNDLGLNIKIHAPYLFKGSMCYDGAILIPAKKN